MSFAADALAPAAVTRRAARREALIAGLRAALAARLPGPGIRAVLLFGSWARGDFEGASDIDLLVLTDPGVPPRAFDTATLPDAARLDVVMVDAMAHAAAAGSGDPFHARVAREAVPLWATG